MLNIPHADAAPAPDALAGVNGVLLAVSGGPDSMGMLHALAGWRRGDTSRVEAASVDHGLRPEAGAEVALVAARCRALGIVHHALRIETPPRRGIQANARFMRYRLLAACARERGLEAVATAHHAGDQAETIAMRLAHGSGMEGLAGIRRHSVFDGVRIVRPFLDAAPEVLRGFAEAGPWVSDPSNEDRRYERVRVRQALDPAARQRLLRLGDRAARLRARREAALRETIAAHCRLLASGHAAMPLAGLAALPEPLRCAVVGALVPAVAGGAHRPPLEGRRRFLARIMNEGGATLAGCRGVVRGGVLWLGREWGRRPPPLLNLSPGRAAIWDGRFAFTVPPMAPGGYSVGPLDGDIGLLPAEIPAALRRAAPVLRDGAGAPVAPGWQAGEWLGAARLSLPAAQVSGGADAADVYAN